MCALSSLMSLPAPPGLPARRGSFLLAQAMIFDPDIYRTAKLLVDQHGEDAPIEAALKADAMLEKADMDGRAVWLRILAAVETLLAEAPDGATVH